MTLGEYYKTTWWKSLRKPLLHNDDCVCEICGRPRWTYYKIGPNKGQRKKKPERGYSVHHLHYRHMFKEQREDVLVLCNHCHDLFHTMEKASKMCPSVYLDAYELMKNKTDWRFEKWKK